MDIAVVVNVDHSGLDKVLNQVVSDLVGLRGLPLLLQLLLELLEVLLLPLQLFKLIHLALNVGLSLILVELCLRDLHLGSSALGGDLHEITSRPFRYYKRQTMRLDDEKHTKNKNLHLRLT